MDSTGYGADLFPAQPPVDPRNFLPWQRNLCERPAGLLLQLDFRGSLLFAATVERRQNLAALRVHNTARWSSCQGSEPCRKNHLWPDHAYQKAKAIEQYLKTNYTYRLADPSAGGVPDGQDPVGLVPL